MAKRESKKLAKYEQEELDSYHMTKQNEIKSLNHLKVTKSFKNKKQKELFNKILENRIVFVKGSPGTGKTYITLLAALECLIDKTININKIALTKPIVEVSKSLGALPGTEKEKTAIYFSHFYNNLEKIIGPIQLDLLKNNNIISEAILNYMRGETFGTYDSNGNPIGSVCILDEAQNTTVKEIKTFITRMGENTKLIICGDPKQVDIKLNKNEKNGFDYCWEYLRDIKFIDFMEFTNEDIVREPLLIEILNKFEKYE